MKEKALLAIQRIIVLMSYLVFLKSQLVEKRLPKKQLKFIFQVVEIVWAVAKNWYEQYQKNSSEQLQIAEIILNSCNLGSRCFSSLQNSVMVV